MGRHTSDEPPTRPMAKIGSQGRHSDDPLDLETPDHHRRNRVLIFLAIVGAMTMLMILVGNLISAPLVDPAGDRTEAVPTVTKTIYETETIEVPEPGPTVTQIVPGPRITPSPEAAPGPTVTVPGPTITVPGPKVTIYVPRLVPVPAPTVTVTITVRPRRKESVVIEDEPTPTAEPTPTGTP